MFGWSRREKLEREVATLRLEKEAHDLRAALGVQNAAGSTATYPLSDPLVWEKLFGPASNAISPDTALKHSAVYRCVFLIAGSISMLPFPLYSVNADGGRQRERTAPLARLIDRRPSARLSASMFWRAIVSDMLLSGNGIAWIERKDATPVALHYVPWARTGIRLDNILGVPTQIYTLTLDNGRMVTAHQDDVLHFPGSAQWQIFRAMSPLTAYAMTVGIGLSADAFAKAYFDNGASPDGYITYPKAVKGGQSDEIRKHWMSRHGGENRFAGPAVLTDGGKFESIRINAADAQLIDTRKFGVEDIARIFGVPPHLVGQVEKATSFGKGLEEQTQSFVDFTLGPHLQAIEDEVNHKLIRDDNRLAEFDREGFVRGDLKTRMEALQIALGGNNGPGLMTQNEGRAKLGLAPSDEPEADRLLTWAAGAQTAAADAAQGAGDAQEAKEETGETPTPKPAKPKKSRARAKT